MRGDNVMQNDRNDLISRQIAIEAIKEDKIDLTNPNVVAVFKATGDFEKVETQVMTCDRHIKMLKELPSAQPERQKGEWIDYTEDGYVECPFCHNATNCDGNKDELHFCFSCGADMREVDGESN